MRDNLPGTREFCPLIRKSPELLEMTRKDLHARAQEMLASYEPGLLRRAAQYLMLKETRSSYEVERETPSQSRIQRFVDLLRTAQMGQLLSLERFVALQNSVLEHFCWSETRRRWRRMARQIWPLQEDITNGLWNAGPLTDDDWNSGSQRPYVEWSGRGAGAPFLHYPRGDE